MKFPWMQVNLKDMADQNPLSKIAGWDFCLEIALPQLVNIVNLPFLEEEDLAGTSSFYL